MYRIPQTIPELLKRNVADFGDRKAFVSVLSRTGEWVRHTWKEMDKISDRLAAGLADLGVRQGQKVAFMQANSAECYYAYLATQKLGAVFVPINIRLVPREIEYIAGHSDAEFLIFGSNFQAQVKEIKDKVNLKRLIGIEKEGEKIPDWAASFKKLLETQGTSPAVSIGPDDVADLTYTTGTTGRPKGVMLTQANKIACGRLIGNAGGAIRNFYKNERSQTSFPFFTSTGTSSTLMNWLYYGFTLILEPVFDVLAALQTIEREKSTFYSAAPSMFIFLLDHPRFKEFDTSSLHHVSSGGSALPEEVIKRMQETWPGVKIFNFYGLTEGGTGGTSIGPTDILAKLGSIGRPWPPDQEARIVDEQDRDVRVGEVGEIVLRGPNVMKGYYKDPEATQETLRNGWLHTGDMGRYDEDGFFYYTDRKKDMIVRGGFNVYPVEVESALYEHPAVKQCAVVAKPHPKLGEDVLALVVLVEGKKATAEQLIAFCSDKLADYKRPREVIFVDSLPLNPMGKVDKKALRATHLSPGKPAGKS
jgi:acyl-CoA synthetase (AMP-forming)/AMP-acid ligase II